MIPINFLSFAVTHVVHLINRIPSTIIGRKTPYELIYKHLPDFHKLNMFGTLFFYLV